MAFTLELEEWVGSAWHRFITRRASADFPAARVELVDRQRSLALLFRALGGASGISLEAASERDLLLEMLAELPEHTLLLADAGLVGYRVLTQLQDHGHAFIVRVGRNVTLLRKLKLAVDAHGFATEAHPKLRPVETLTAGYFLAGAGQGPRDIPETVAQASAAAAKVLAMFGSTKLTHSPTTAAVDEETCVGCGYCERTCAYEAVKVDLRRRKAVVNAALCEGCGACAVACPSGAMSHKNFGKRSLFEMVDSI